MGRKPALRTKINHEKIELAKRELKMNQETEAKRMKIDPDVIVIEARNDMSDEDLRDEDMPGPSHAFNPPSPADEFDNQDVKNYANIQQEFRDRRQAILNNLNSSLNEMEADYNAIAILNDELLLDRQTSQRLKRDIDELAAEIQLKSAQKDVLDKKYETINKKIETNEKSLDSAEERIRTFEVRYKRDQQKPDEKPGKVGEFECPICKEICGTEEKHMVCLINCGHRFCKDCIDRVLDDANNDREERRRHRINAFLDEQQRLFNGFDGVRREAEQARQMAVELRQAADEIRRGPRQARIARRAARPYGVRLDVPGDPVAADAQPAPAGAEGDNNAADPLADNVANPPAAGRQIPRLYQRHRLGRHMMIGRDWRDDNFGRFLNKRCPTCQKNFRRENVVRLF
ncbi:Oidioi.mRNA.OKI2018_I69.PAR.g12232.t2.cds [Oikopleura dioica]|uniref:Oidioi.mRNA.OKI2018_I69.PAR.g12232.t2.cds n=1 Tax=Oikopleura dioica TaxID=34765 RepID=A0ABN7RZN5_OIKDI|nr:Oidioi.mRNA.OKI2018_I69.PAR.g12232.t2.cds [Oikopleura dioica]